MGKSHSRQRKSHDNPTDISSRKQRSYQKSSGMKIENNKPVLAKKKSSSLSSFGDEKSTDILNRKNTKTSTCSKNSSGSSIYFYRINSTDVVNPSDTDNHSDYEMERFGRVSYQLKEYKDIDIKHLSNSESITVLFQDEYDYPQLYVSNISTDSSSQSDSCSRTNFKEEFDTHDVEVMDSESDDVEKKFSDCKKHPGHMKFIPVGYLNEKQLPEGCHDYEMLDLIHATVNLTVRVVTRTVSNQRPVNWHGGADNYPFHGDDDGKIRYGSGRIEQVTRQSVDIGGTTTCPCSKCKNSGDPKTAWWLIRVSTAAHLVFDDNEAKGATCTLFYDSKDVETVDIEGLRIQTKDVEWDTCKLLCVVCDSSLADKIDKYVDEFVAAWEQAFDRYFDDEKFKGEKLAVVVSHPHGYFKHITVGRWTNKVKEKTEDGAVLKQYTYNTHTCPGSAGAYVLVPDFNDI